MIIECGTKFGGGAFLLATICQLLGSGRVITIDIAEQPDRPNHVAITYVTGSSTDAATVDKVKAMIRPNERVMVILDSDHRAPHVLRELQIYADLVSPGCYLIVEDGNINGNPVFPQHGPGPLEAVREFLTTEERFVVDDNRGERHLLTLNPKRYLRRSA